MNRDHCRGADEKFVHVGISRSVQKPQRRLPENKCFHDLKREGKQVKFKFSQKGETKMRTLPPERVLHMDIKCADGMSADQFHANPHTWKLRRLFVFATPVDYPSMAVFDGTDFCNLAIQRVFSTPRVDWYQRIPISAGLLAENIFEGEKSSPRSLKKYLCIGHAPIMKINILTIPCCRLSDCVLSF